jgi:hypothetical protein
VRGNIVLQGLFGRRHQPKDSFMRSGIWIIAAVAAVVIIVMFTFGADDSNDGAAAPPHALEQE